MSRPLKSNRFALVASLGAAVACFLSAGQAQAQARNHGSQTEYDGSFSEVESSGGVCDDVFAASSYHNRHFVTGPTGRTSVLNFAGDQDGAFFDHVTFVGLLGGSGDLDYDKTVAYNGSEFEVNAQGLIDRSVVYLEFVVVANDAQGHEICRTKANYTGFN